MQPDYATTFPTFHADKVDNVSVKYLGDQIIETGLGKIDCFVLVPTVDKGKVLKRSDGIRFFISKKTKLPVLLEFDMRLGITSCRTRKLHSGWQGAKGRIKKLHRL